MIKYIFPIMVLSLYLLGCNQVGKQQADTTKTSDTIIETVIPQPAIYHYLDSLGLVNIENIDSTIQVELKYTTTDNFTGNVLYKELRKAYLHPLAADKLAKAQSLLKAHNPNLSLLIYDAVRPLSIQKELFEAVKNTKLKAYVADPSKTGLHNYGMAVDLTICDQNKAALDMGTKFDYFGKEAAIRNEKALVEQGLLTPQQVENRLLLRSIMTQSGFIAIAGEWWHFNACYLRDAKQQATLVQ